MALRLRPITIKGAKRLIAKLHRHNEVPQGALFAVAVEHLGEIVGCATVGRPIARKLDDGRTAEATRLVSDGTTNVCSMLYSASTRAAAALGFRKIITYILATEPGTSLKAAGWEPEADVETAPTWDRLNRRRVQQDLFGNERRPKGPKVRWAKALTPEAKKAGRPDRERVKR